MAAAVLCRSIEVSRVCKTKDLFILFTLLSLLCPASAWIDKGKLKEIKENILKLQQDAVMRRVDNMVDRIYLPKILEDVLQLMDHLADLLTRVLPESRSLPKLMLELKKYLKESLDYLKKYLQKESVRTQEYEENVKQLEKVLEKLTEGEANM